MHTAEHIMHAHLHGVPTPTVTSVGALYCLLIAADNDPNEPIVWPRVHAEIRDTIGMEDDAAWIRKLDRIKKVGWDLHAAVCKRVGEPAEAAS